MGEGGVEGGGGCRGGKGKDRARQGVWNGGLGFVGWSQAEGSVPWRSPR